MNTQWDDDEIALLLARDDNGQWKYSNEELGDELGRTYEGVRIKRGRLHRAEIEQDVSLPINKPELRLQRVIDECTSLWNDAQDRLRKLDRPARLAKVGDQHHPYADPYAMELAREIIADFDPDVLPGLDDWFDFPGYSSFAEARSWFHQRWDSDLELVLTHHEQELSRWREVAPNAAMPSLMGNHDVRVWKFLRTRADIAAEYTLGKMAEDMAGHGLLFLGERANTIDLSPGFRIAHGHRASKNTATAIRGTLDDLGWQRSVAMSHVHRMAAYTKSGPDYSVTGMASGCLCELTPHYHDRPTDWQHGILLAYYDPNGRSVAMYNVEFIHQGGEYVAYWNDREYRVKARMT